MKCGQEAAITETVEPPSDEPIVENNTIVTYEIIGVNNEPIEVVDLDATEEQEKKVPRKSKRNKRKASVELEGDDHDGRILLGGLNDIKETE